MILLLDMTRAPQAVLWLSGYLYPDAQDMGPGMEVGALGFMCGGPTF
jgi:hypothetical protein